VVEYEEFMAQHGETGGWDPEDHEEFVRILKACAGDYVQATNITLERCIGFTKAEVMQHARCVVVSLCTVTQRLGAAPDGRAHLLHHFARWSPPTQTS
jgi:hypothetical protein